MGSRCRINTKLKDFAFEKRKMMSPDEVIEKTKALGITVSRSTLTRYTKYYLVSKPQRGSLGRGGGRWAAYPSTAPLEVATAKLMLSGEAFMRYFESEDRVSFSMPLVAHARISSTAYMLEMLRIYNMLDELHDYIPDIIPDDGQGDVKYISQITAASNDFLHLQIMRERGQDLYAKTEDTFEERLSLEIRGGFSSTAVFLYMQTYINLVKAFKKG